MVALLKRRRRKSRSTVEFAPPRAHLGMLLDSYVSARRIFGGVIIVLPVSSGFSVFQRFDKKTRGILYVAEILHSCIFCPE